MSAELTMKNALGQDVPVSMVKEIDKLRDALVMDAFALFEAAGRELKRLKEH